MMALAMAGLIAALILMIEHWLPWQLALRRRLPRLLAYGMGVLGLMVPLSGLFAWWAIYGALGPWWWLGGLWFVVICGGLAVLSCYGIDGMLKRIAQSHETRELLNLEKKRNATRPDKD